MATQDDPGNDTDSAAVCVMLSLLFDELASLKSDSDQQRNEYLRDLYSRAEHYAAANGARGDAIQRVFAAITRL